MPVLCEQVRGFLDEVSRGHPPPEAPEVFQTLVARGAIQEVAGHSEITAIGRHVLDELSVRAYRTDALPLDAVAQELESVLAEMDSVAKTGEYFLAELGPVTPADALPLLRPVAVGLANRRESPEELAEEFRNIWGSVEVMGGDARDRLLAAELLCHSSAPMSRIYAPMMTTSNTLREWIGPSAPVVSVAALLHLMPRPDGTPALEEFRALRGHAPSDEAVALLANGGRDPGRIVELYQRFLKRLAPGTSTPDAGSAASYLAALGDDPEVQGPRVLALASALSPPFLRPLTPAAVLASRSELSTDELLNWYRKAFEIVRNRQLAPTDGELGALAVGIVRGLRHDRFEAAREARGPADGGESEEEALATLVALHAWTYRPLLERRGASERAVPAA